MPSRIKLHCDYRNCMAAMNRMIMIEKGSICIVNGDLSLPEDRVQLFEKATPYVFCSVKCFNAYVFGGIDI